MSRPSPTIRRRAHRQIVYTVLALLMLYSPVSWAVQPDTRIIKPLTEGWRFINTDASGAESAQFDDSDWKTVTLPHDWSIAGPVKEDNPSRAQGGFFPTGIGWYRETFNVSTADIRPDLRTFVVFEGVMANSDVYINGVHLGHRPYGYVSFVYELTPHLHRGANTLAVRVDNSDQPASRWYAGAGIYRQVRLVTTNATHIVPWGTFVTTPKVSASSATVHIRSTFINESTLAVEVSLRVRLIGPHGEVVSHQLSSGRPVTLKPGAQIDLATETTISHPNRWDIDNPVLYEAEAIVLKNGKVVDEEDVPFGIRKFHFDPARGFFLNGVHHKILGVAIHADGGAVGTAIPLAIWEQRLTALRKLGVNAIRTAHNPPSPGFLDLADRMGFLVLDEMFDGWTIQKSRFDYHLYFKDWYLRDTADTVMRDRNHPSVTLWSAGNEVHDTMHPDIGIPVLKNLLACFHRNDPTRPVTEALLRPNVSHDYDDGWADLLDVVGQNYREQEILAAYAQKPTRKILGTENSHTPAAWVALRDHPEYSGQFLWTGIDYLGEAGRWPAIGSGSGLLLSNGLTRPRALERQSWWSERPMVAMARRVEIRTPTPLDPGYAPAHANPKAPHVDSSLRFHQPLLADWTPKDLSPHKEQVEVYTNADEVELLLNGHSLGRQSRHENATPIVYEVSFVPGKLRAIAFKNGTVVASNVLQTAGKPDHLDLSLAPAKLPLTADWNDARYIVARLVDARGVQIPDSQSLVRFHIEGPGEIIAVDNGNMLDHEPFQAAQRTLYSGATAAIVRADGKSGKIVVRASTPNLKPTSITLQLGPIADEDLLLAHLPAWRRGF